jgi:hypothetical protein
VNRRAMARLATLALGFFALTATGSAHYFYYYIVNGSPTIVKFDLTTLVNNSLPFYIADEGPSALVAGDSFQAVISEVRAAAAVWNGVGSSNIQLAYGGLFTEGRIDSAPSVDVHFSDDVPPGLLAIGGPESLGVASTDANGVPFYPITRSQLLLPSDMTQLPFYGPIPSYSENFFVTLVHEFGHTLGLQHSLASSVMSTLTTSASSKGTPLAPDDIAGISVLYPAGKYLSTVGSISGSVTLNGTGVNLASVVAITANTPAITALTNPDGTYQIDGVPPGPYYVYVQPLPAPLASESAYDNLIYPRDSSGNGIPPNYASFVTQFYTGANGGTQNPQQAELLGVSAGNVTGGINFSVAGEAAEAVASVRTYGYTKAGIYVIPAPVTLGSSSSSLIAATGVGLLQANNTVTPDLNVSALGAAISLYAPEAYPPPQPYIALYVQQNTFAIAAGPKHLLFSTPGDIYVLPSAFTMVVNPPPSITSATPTFDANGNRAVAVAGTTFLPDTIILFDGLPGAIESVQADGSLLVTPPQAPGGYTATVVALSSDGQSSLFLGGPQTYTYDPAGAASLVVRPPVLAPRTETTLTITGTNTNFIAGVTLVGFGTSDAVVEQVTVLSPTAMTVLVSTANSAIPASAISVTTGLNVISQALGNQVTAADSLQTGN